MKNAGAGAGSDGNGGDGGGAGGAVVVVMLVVFNGSPLNSSVFFALVRTREGLERVRE